MNFVTNRLYKDSRTILVELAGPTFNITLIKVVAFLAHSSNIDSHDSPRKSILGAQDFAKVFLARMRKFRRMEIGTKTFGNNFGLEATISGNRLSTSVHYKPTDSHSYLLHSSSHPAHVKNSQFLRLRRLCSDDTDFSEKAEEMCQFSKTRSDPVIHNSKHRAQSVHPLDNRHHFRHTTSYREESHSHSHFTHITFQLVKNIILKNFKLPQHDPTTAEIFAQPLLISYKRDKNLSNFLVKSTLKSNHQPGTFKCARVRCRTCPFISNANKISGPKRTVAITDHFSCISTNLIYCITCTLCKKYTSAKRAADW